MEIVREFINKRSTLDVELRDRLHAIWLESFGYFNVSWLMLEIGRYCIPLDVDRRLAESELDFFKEGTGTGEPLPALLMMSNSIGASSFGGCFHQI